MGNEEYENRLGCLFNIDIVVEVILSRVDGNIRNKINVVWLLRIVFWL